MRKILIIFVITHIIILMVLGVPVIMSKFNEPALQINITVNDTLITNITFKEITVPIIYGKIDTKADFPEVNAIARVNNIQSIPISYWSSVHTPGEGSYSMIMVFRTKPQENDTLIIPLRYTDFKGRILHKTTSFYEWK